MKFPSSRRLARLVSNKDKLWQFGWKKTGGKTPGTVCATWSNMWHNYGLLLSTYFSPQITALSTESVHPVRHSFSLPKKSCKNSKEIRVFLKIYKIQKLKREQNFQCFVGGVIVGLTEPKHLSKLRVLNKRFICCSFSCIAKQMRAIAASAEGSLVL